MKLDIGVYAYGEFDGAPCVDVSIGKDDLVHDIAESIHKKRRAGDQCINIVQAPWGTEHADRTLLAISSDGRLSDMPILCRRALSDGKWASVSILWQGDVSFLMKGQKGVKAIFMAMGALPFFPQLYELVIKDPDIENVTPQVLDELHLRLQPTGCGWIYLTESRHGDASRVSECIARCDTPWRVRLYAKRPSQK